MTKAVTDKSSTNKLLTVSQQKTIPGAGTNGDSGWQRSVNIYTALKHRLRHTWFTNDRHKTEMERCNAYWLLSTTAQPESLWHRDISSDSGCQIWRHTSSSSAWTEEWFNVQSTTDATCKGQPEEDAEHSPVLGRYSTGRQTRHASHANTCILLCMWLTMIPQTKL